jgi:hypothetical protein
VSGAGHSTLLVTTVMKVRVPLFQVEMGNTIYFFVIGREYGF